MEDRPDDLPKPARSAGARPFFSPRPKPTDNASAPRDLGRRSAAQLFTPPSSSPAARVADKVAGAPVSQKPAPVEIPSSSAADGSTDVAASAAATETAPDVDFEGDATAAPLAEHESEASTARAHGGDVDEDRFVVEQFEPEEIRLTSATPSAGSEYAIESIEYDDANRLLEATTNDGEDPEIDGIYLESTEFSFDHMAPRIRSTADSFWATEPVKPKGASAPESEAADAPDETEATIDEATAGDADDERELALRMMGSEPSIDEQPVEWTDDPSTTIAHAQAAAEPEPEHDPPPAAKEATKLPDFAPPWMSRLTPKNLQALELMKESEPWELTPAHGEEEVAPTAYEPAAEAEPAPAPASAAKPGNDVADALERIAARVRDGGIDVATGSGMSDESALSAVLTALLQSRR